jgi:hypothetical protein
VLGFVYSAGYGELSIGKGGVSKSGKEFEERVAVGSGSPPQFVIAVRNEAASSLYMARHAKRRGCFTRSSFAMTKFFNSEIELPNSEISFTLP